MAKDNNFYITTPIYYVNDVPHIGHAYTTIAADVLARYWRLRGRKVFFLTGLDEHGQKVQQAATKAGIDPQAHCDKLAPQFEQLWKKLNISNSAFIRTTDPPHKSVVQRYLQQLYDKNLIYKDSYTGWYCTFDERFWTEKDVESGVCPDCKRPVEQLSEHNYFFKMGQYQDHLLDHIKKNPSFIRPESRRNEVLGFLQTQKLGDLSISRPKSRLSWGIELPFDNNYVTYVWFDALVNYISALEYKLATPSVEQYWPASVHLVGKDILTTHAVYWSTMLMALNLPLPEKIFAHGWWTVDGEKMSKSRGNVVDPHHIVDQFGVDAFRYFLLREVPFGQDGDFSQAAMITRVNSDLANGLGNLLSRTLTLIERTQAGQVPAPEAIGPLEQELQGAAVGLLNEILPHYFEQLEFNRALESIWQVVQLANQYVDKTAPWMLAKTDRDAAQLKSVLYTMAETLRCLSLAAYPVIPKSVQSLCTQLGLSVDFTNPLLKHKIEWGGLKPGTTIHKGQSLFPRIEKQPGAKPVTESSVPSQPIPATSTTTTPQAPSAAPQITIDEFMKIQLKTAKVLSAERVPKSEKLIKLQVSVGTEQRQIVAGIGKKYEPDALLGKTIVIVANLKPAKLMGIESQGMVLAAGDADVHGLLTVLEEVDPGTKVK
ncbi:MAG: methionine--tRNA ligase [Nitrospira sp.]|jgi:methionyl-tRNA synthetase|nr:methionine--tRNA ligase [Nitrospira sp.]MDH4242871.1 methionine--tRNA ligase [Nitrospira sp.]MDH4357490.1 methionine--tRNA ligase [Nitrospira sp.]MDH5319723.1 methionine--tRNA ligase [Nitrospira sp.]